MNTNLSKTETTIKYEVLSGDELKKDVNHLFSTLDSYGDDNGFFEMNCDFLAMVMPEFIASERFTTLGADRRKKLFNQYESLKEVLVDLEKFIEKYPNISKVREIELEVWS